MDSRMKKYSENESMSRVSRNHELYKEINNGELDGFSVKSNATVIGNQEPEIDIEKIKKILDTKYNEVPKRRSIRIEQHEVEKIVDDVPTKEYDLNVILEKAKGEKQESYEEVRAKKLRNTQYDILNNLKIDANKYTSNEERILKIDDEKPEINKAEEDLMELIHTITLNEAKIKEDAKKEDGDDEFDTGAVDPLSILEDLKGSEDTAVYDKMVEEVKTSATSNIVLNEETKEEKKLEEKEEVDTKIDDSFYTKSLFKKKDFVDDDFADVKTNVWIKVVIIIVVIAFAVGLFFFLRSFLDF